MNLKNILNQIDSLDNDATIFAKKPWMEDSEVFLRASNEKSVTDDLKAKGYEYFLEVFVIKEVLEVFENRKVSLEDKFNLIVFYAENDAYPEWVYK
jgi:hypothetical protein